MSFTWDWWPETIDDVVYNAQPAAGYIPIDGWWLTTSKGMLENRYWDVLAALSGFDPADPDSVALWQFAHEQWVRASYTAWLHLALLYRRHMPTRIDDIVDVLEDRIAGLEDTVYQLLIVVGGYTPVEEIAPEVLTLPAVTFAPWGDVLHQALTATALTPP